MIRNVTSEIGVCRRKVLTLTLVSLLPQHAPIRSHTQRSQHFSGITASKRGQIHAIDVSPTR